MQVPVIRAGCSLQSNSSWLGVEVSARGGGAAGKPVQEGWQWAPGMVGSTCQAMRHAGLSFGEVRCLG